MRRLRRAHQRHTRKNAKSHNNLKTGALAAGTAAAITFGTGLSANRVLADGHQLPVAQDADADLLCNREEFAIGYRPFRPDQNRNQTIDGAELAKRCAEIIDQLPWSNEALPGQTYRWCELQLGLETCDICGVQVNMGPAGIVNPRLNISVDCPLIAIHYMEHGSLSYGGNVHAGRLDVPALLRALELRFPYDPNEHQLPLDYVVEPVGQLAPDANDLDDDLLADSEELAVGSNLHDTDQDKDLTPDGIELAKQCVEIIDALPVWNLEGDPPAEGTYKANFFQRGIELCEICGGAVNMGSWEIVNTNLGLSIAVNDITCHYMSHGSFSYSGDLHHGRIDIPALLQALEMPKRCHHLGAVRLPSDTNEDCTVNFKDVAELADRWLNCTDPNDPSCDQ